MKLIRSLFSLAVLIALVYFATAIPLGKKTLWQHVRAIAGSRESQDLVHEVKTKARQVVEPDSGGSPVPAPAPAQDDKLSLEERKLLRKLIRQKMEQGRDAEAEPRTAQPAQPGK